MPLSSADLLQNVLEKKPSEFAGNFSSMVQDRVRDLIAGKRVEVAQNLFGTPPIEMASTVDTTDTGEAETGEGEAPEAGTEDQPETEEIPDDQETA